MRLTGVKVVIALGDSFDSRIFHGLVSCLSGAGAAVQVASANKYMELIDSRGAELIKPDLSFKDMQDLKFDALVLGDSTASSELRSDDDLLNIIRHAHSAGVIIATIGRSARYLIDAGVASTHSLTASPDIRQELAQSGADFINEAVWVDGNLVSGRTTDDFQDFCQVLVDELIYESAA